MHLLFFPQNLHIPIYDAKQSGPSPELTAQVAADACRCSSACHNVFRCWLGSGFSHLPP